MVRAGPCPPPLHHGYALALTKIGVSQSNNLNAISMLPLDSNVLLPRKIVRQLQIDIYQKKPWHQMHKILTKHSLSFTVNADPLNINKMFFCLIHYVVNFRLYYSFPSGHDCFSVCLCETRGQNICAKIEKGKSHMNQGFVCISLRIMFACKAVIQLYMIAII